MVWHLCFGPCTIWDPRAESILNKLSLKPPPMANTEFWLIKDKPQSLHMSHIWSCWPPGRGCKQWAWKRRGLQTPRADSSISSVLGSPHIKPARHRGLSTIIYIERDVGMLTDEWNNLRDTLQVCHSHVWLVCVCAFESDQEHSCIGDYLWFHMLAVHMWFWAGLSF